MASYDNGRVDWFDEPGETYREPVSWTPPEGFGDESWQWLLLRPLAR